MIDNLIYDDNDNINEENGENIKEGNEKCDNKSIPQTDLTKKINLNNKQLKNNFINSSNYKNDACNERDGEDIEKNEQNNINKFASLIINNKIKLFF